MFGCLNSSADITNIYGMVGSCSIFKWWRDVCLPDKDPTGSGIDAASYIRPAGGFSQGVKRPVREADQSPSLVAGFTNSGAVFPSLLSFLIK
jgi:hypothetical protein